MSEVLEPRQSVVTAEQFAIGTQTYRSDTFVGFEVPGGQRERCDDLYQEARSLPGVRFLISGLEEVDDWHTIEHEERVGYVEGAMLIGLGYPDKVVLDGIVSGLVHDSWKRHLQHIIHLQRRIKASERHEVEEHAIGGAILARVAELPVRVQGAVYHHHDYGSKPYNDTTEHKWVQPLRPGRLSAAHAIGTVLAAVDVYDASRSARPERPEPRTHDESMRWVDELYIPREVKQVFASMFRRHVEDVTAAA